MNQQQAIAKLRKLIGPKLAWIIHKNALNTAERERQREVSRHLSAEQKALHAELDELRRKLLSDPVYVELRARWEAAKAAAERASSLAYHKPIDVGTKGELFFTVLASGDNWAEVVRNVEAAVGERRAQA